MGSGGSFSHTAYERNTSYYTYNTHILFLFFFFFLTNFISLFSYIAPSLLGIDLGSTTTDYL